MSQKGFAHIIFLVVLCIVLVIAGTLFVLTKRNKSLVDEKSFDKSEFTQVYSNGWYDYSFKYPPGAVIKYAIGSVNGKGDTIDVRQYPIGNDKSYPCSITVSPKDSQFTQEIEKTQKSISFNGISWAKEKFISQQESALYRYPGVVWQAEKNQLTYTFNSHQGSEQWCEAVISTFKFSVDSSVESALESVRAKEAALLYSQKKYPKMFFLEGRFVNDFERTGDQLGVLDFSTNALIYLADSGNATLQEQVRIKVSKQKDKWVVVGEYKN